MNILLLDKSIDGGTGTFIRNLVKLQKLDRKISIKTLVLERPSSRSTHYLKFTSFRHRGFYPKSYALTFLNFLNFIGELFWLKTNIQKFAPDIVVGIDLRSNILALMAKLLFFRKLKVVATVHINLEGTPFDNSVCIISPILKRALRFFYNKANVVVCVSRQLALSLKDVFGVSTKIVTIYYGTDLKIGSPKHLGKKKKIIITTIARLNRQKDFRTLIRAFKLVHEKKTNTELWIFGEGPDRKSILKYVTQLGLTKQILFKGWTNNVGSHLRKSDLFVLSSKREGFAYVIIEAMTQGLPVVSTDTPYGPSEILGKGEYGILVSMSDPFSMYNAVSDLVSNKSKYDYYSQKSIARSRFFSVPKMLRNYQKVFTSVL